MSMHDTELRAAQPPSTSMFGSCNAVVDFRVADICECLDIFVIMHSSCLLHEEALMSLLQCPGPMRWQAIATRAEEMLQWHAISHGVSVSRQLQLSQESASWNDLNGRAADRRVLPSFAWAAGPICICCSAVVAPLNVSDVQNRQGEP